MTDYRPMSLDPLTGVRWCSRCESFLALLTSAAPDPLCPVCLSDDQRAEQ